MDPSEWMACASGGAVVMLLIGALQSAWNLCDADCLRLTRIVGQRGAPAGERIYQFIVTPEGAKAVR